MTFVAELEPQALWKYFDTILTIPRGSKEEDRIRAWVVEVAEGLGCPTTVDEAGNVVVKKPGSPGHESSPATILQAHLDMVNDKNSDVEHDFSKDPIQPRQDGEYLTASGTTLGSDNGIGVAAMLAIMEANDLVHGPIEFLFTIDEETGLNGAMGVDGSLFDARRLINLDSEEEGAVTVGCAGGADTTVKLPLTGEAAPAEAAAFTVKLHGMQGGHSGIDIHLQRGNSNKLLARMLHSVYLETPFHLAAFQGGNKHNAIPRESFATVVVGASHKDALSSALAAEFAGVKEEFAPADPDMALEVAESAAPGSVWDTSTTLNVLRLVTGLPHGVLAMSYDIPGLVETSTNLAVVQEADGSMEILMSSRSSVATALEATRQRIRATAELAGASAEEHVGYPGWKPDLDSRLLQVVKSVHARVLGSDPHVEAVHAGLECGLIGEKIPGMDMISFGPQIEFPHSPNERVKVDSVGRFHDLLTAVMEDLAT